MIKGINKKEENIIQKILKPFPYKFYYYGSRVKGDFTKGSDLDILIKSNKEIPEKVLNELSLKFNQSRIPYIVNFTDFNKIDEDFFKLISSDLISVF